MSITACYNYSMLAPWHYNNITKQLIVNQIFIQTQICVYIDVCLLVFSLNGSYLIWSCSTILCIFDFIRQKTSKLAASLKNKTIISVIAWKTGIETEVH